MTIVKQSKISKKMIGRICEGIRQGLRYKEVAESCGICYATFRNWMNWGEENQTGLYALLYRSVKVAQAEAEKKLLGIIHRAAEGGQVFEDEELYYDSGNNLKGRKVSKKVARPDAKSAQWILSRRYPKRYSEQMQMQLSLKDEEKEDEVDYIGKRIQEWEDMETAEKKLLEVGNENESL